MYYERYVQYIADYDDYSTSEYLYAIRLFYFSYVSYSLTFSGLLLCNIYGNNIM